MLKRMKAKKIISVIVVCCTLISVRPAQAFIWPTIDISQISSFVTSITNGMTTITNAKSQLENITKTIKAVGDQIATIKKYVADLKGTIAKIKESIESAINAVKDAIEEIKDAVEEVVNTVKDTLGIEEENAENIVTSVNNGVDEGASEDDIQAIIDAAKAESEENKNKVNTLYDETLNNINKTLDDAEKAVDIMVEGINEQEGISNEDKEALKAKADDIKEEIDDLKQEASNLINDLKDQYNKEYAEKIANAYDEYSKAVSDYYSGKIDATALKEAGEAFKESIKSTDIEGAQELLTEFSNKIDNVVNSIEELKEEILNAVSNDKEYSDEDEDDVEVQLENTTPLKTHSKPNLQPSSKSLKFKSPKLSYKYISNKEMNLAKSFYNEDTSGKEFLISNELFCGKGKFGIDDIKKLSESNKEFRKCVVKARIEVEDEDLESIEAKYKDFFVDNDEETIRRDGVYKHILQDYSAANIVTISKSKQFAASWLGNGETGDSEYDALKDMVSKGDVDNSLNGVVAMTTIDLWSPRLWSYIRRVDAVARAKNVVNLFMPETKLHLDKHDDVVDALNDAPGTIDDKKVFPHVMLHQCQLDANDVSVDYEANDSNTDSQKDKLIECMKMYACGASLGDGTCEGKSDNKETQKQIWREKQKMALNDAAFENLTLAVIANYNSTNDYIRRGDDGEPNIVMLQDGIKQVAQSRDGYAAGAQINYYSTQQLLNIVDSDALDLQAEILKDLQNFDFSYFPKDE